MKTFRVVLINVFIAAAILAAIEIGIRLLAPQTVKTTYYSEARLARADKTLGHTNGPGAHALVEAPEFAVQYRIDERGFRLMSDGTVERPERAADPEATRVLLIGDSFTFGAANDQADIWPAMLGQRFRETGRAVEIVNAGVPGYDTSQQALYLERLFATVDPDIVVLSLLPNDVFVNEPIRIVDGREVAQGDGSAVVARGGGKRSDLHSVTFLKRLLMTNDRLYAYLYALTPRRQFFELPASDLVSRKLGVTGDLLERIRAFCAERNVPLVVLSIPQLYQVIREALQDEGSGINVAMVDDALADFAAQDGVHWISALEPLTQRYASRGRDLYFRFDGHLNREGNEVVSELAETALSPLLKEGSMRQVLRTKQP